MGDKVQLTRRGVGAVRYHCEEVGGDGEKAGWKGEGGAASAEKAGESAEKADGECG